MKQFILQSNFVPRGDQPAAIHGLVNGLRNSELNPFTLLGVTGSGKTYTMAQVIAAVQRPTLILAPNKTLAAQLYGEFKDFFPENAVEYFVSYYDYYQPEAYIPSSDTYIAKDSSINDQIEQMRLSATKSLLERRDVIIVASVSAIYGLGDPNSYLRMILHLIRGEYVDDRAIIRRLAELQYTRNEIELQRGTFRMRGEILDIFPADAEYEAIRIEFFDSIIESIRIFNPLTGTVLRQLSRVTIYPKTHYVTPREIILRAVEKIKAELQDRYSELYAAGKLIEAQRIEQRTRFDLEMLVEIGYCTGIENYSRHLSGREIGEPPPTLFDYLPGDALLFIDESHVTIPQLGAMYRGDRARKENLVNYGFRLPSALDNRPLRFDEFERRSPPTIYVSATPGDYELRRSALIVEQVVRPTGIIDPIIEVRPACNQIDDLLSEIRRTKQNSFRVLVTTLTKRLAENLTEYLAEHNIAVRYLHSDINTVERIEIIRDLRLGVFDVLVGINLLREGLDIPEVALVAILDADKEGFLRSERSLIQTIGRAARNIYGRVIMYADQITNSMQRAIDITAERRRRQQGYNETHGITPQGIEKAVNEVLDLTGALSPGGKDTGKTITPFLEQSPAKIVMQIKKLEQEMYRCAKNLEFEDAARLRDEIRRLENFLQEK